MPNTSQSAKKRGRGRPKGSKNKTKSSANKTTSNGKPSTQPESSAMGRGPTEHGRETAEGSANAPNPPPYGSPPISISSGDGVVDDDFLSDYSEPEDGWNWFENLDLSHWRDVRHIARTLAERAEFYSEFWSQRQRDRLALAFLACANAMNATM
ncbi:hypothetical protein A4X13_0g4895 [Tilletia indica]|uniref:Uncharacterized protein n=1 Tax=Tilletia indica TaxID=43049 RepID=A0A177TP65_9BASI|nr:hypothetical protein A4X13_0g4895 [Tilletia indica]